MQSDGLMFLHCDHLPRCAATVDKRFTYHTLQFITAGCVDLSYGDDEYELDGPWCFPAMPGPWIRFRSGSPGQTWDHRYIAFQGSRVDAWAAEGLLLGRPQAVDGRLIRELTPVFDRMIDQASRVSRYGRLRAINLLEQVLLLLAEARDASAHPDQPAWLSGTLAELRRLDHEPDYERLAADAAMSVSNLRRRFKRATGMSPHAFRMQHRAGEARLLLSDTDEPIKVIADRLGYRDVYYFTRHFTQATGVSPGAFRKSRQG
ncbi:MAG: helix-turn-helix transcriptional regulator [Planctomycetota bacterium]